MTDLPCACEREPRRGRDHSEIVSIKRGLRNLPEALAYVEELEALWADAKRRGNVWRSIASAMGYEPNAHKSVRPTHAWLLERIAKFRAEPQSPKMKEE